MARFCSNCGRQMEDNQNFCTYCGTSQTGVVANTSINSTTGEGKSKIAAGLLGIFVGAWGVHNFYLGYTNKGIMQIIVTVVTCGIGGIWGFIEGILILVGEINKDADGVPLKD